MAEATPAKKVVGRKKTTAKKTGVKRTRKPATPMKGSVKTAAAKAVGAFVEDLLAAEDVGVLNSQVKELQAPRSGMTARVKLDDGGSVLLSVTRR